MDYSIQGNSRWVADSNLVWTNRPFYLEYDKRSQYNELGMRVSAGDVFMPPQKKNEFWVFLFGGSAMAGMGSNKDGEWIDITGVGDHTIDESIDGYLLEYLQKALPNKKVRVFNTAVSGHTSYQSFIRYKLLKKYKPDWVVSMDGINDPKSLKNNESTYSYINDQWKNDPSQNSPMSYSLFVMSHSALLNKLKMYIYYKRQAIRTLTNTQSSSVIKNKWLNHKPEPIKYVDSNQYSMNAVNSFFSNLKEFKDTLDVDKQKYLLLIQPYMALRDTTKLYDTEKAVYNYFSCNYNNDTTNTYINLVHKRLKSDFKNDKNIFSMDAIHNCDGWILVDYCHFTNDANKKIAEEISKYIISNGTYIPFQK